MNGATLETLGEGFHVVAQRETRGLHRNHPRSVERRMSAAERAWLASRFDPMAYQAACVLRAVLTDLRAEA